MADNISNITSNSFNFITAIKDSKIFKPSGTISIEYTIPENGTYYIDAFSAVVGNGNRDYYDNGTQKIFVNNEEKTNGLNNLIRLEFTDSYVGVCIHSELSLSGTFSKGSIIRFERTCIATYNTYQVGGTAVINIYKI